MVECLPLDPTAQVLFPPPAVGIFLHPVTFGGQYVGPRLGFRTSLRMKCPGITAWFRVDSGTNQFKAGKYVVGIGILHTSFYCLAVEAGFYSDVVECLPLDPTAQVRFPPRAVGIFLHPVTFGGQYVGPRLGFRTSLRMKCPGITAWFRVDSGTNQFKAGKYVVGIGI